MFGVGIFEILVILIVAVIALGPDKLPQAIVDIVKFFRAVKKTMLEAKDTFDKEIQLAEIKEEALKYKQTLTDEVDKITKDIELDKLRQISVDDITKPIQESKEILNEHLHGIQNLDTEVSYESPSSSAESPDNLKSPTNEANGVQFNVEKKET